MSINLDRRRELDAIAFRLPVVAGTIMTAQMPGDLARTVSVLNRSHLWVYISASSAAPAIGGGIKSVPPFTSSVFPVGATAYVTFRVDVGPDGSTGTSQPNEEIDVAASPLPSPAGQDVPIGGAVTGPTSNVTVTQLPGASALADGFANPSTTDIGAFLQALNLAGTWDRVRASADNTEQSPVGAGALRVVASQFLYNPATGLLERARTPTVVRTATATAAGSTAVWTPASGKRFRLLSYIVQVTENATLAAAGVLTVQLYDGTTAIGLAHDLYVPATAVSGLGAALVQQVRLPGNGYLSSAANNVLNVNLSAALATGQARIVAVGTEE